MSFLYACGCAADQVGQSFVHGVLVCPEHQEPVATGPAVEQPWRGRATMSFGLVARDHEEAAVVVDQVATELANDERVTDVVLSLEAR